jgi:hypothetical protein
MEFNSAFKGLKTAAVLNRHTENLQFYEFCQKMWTLLKSLG